VVSFAALTTEFKMNGAPKHSKHLVSDDLLVLSHFKAGFNKTDL
jgi:hypothetical protein